MANRQVLMLVGGRYHDFDGCAAVARDLLARSGCELTVTDDRDALARPLDELACVIIFTCGGEFSADQQAALARYVRAGGGIVAIHSAVSVEGDCGAYVALLGSQFDRHPHGLVRVEVSIADASHPAVAGVEAFAIDDELYFLKNVAADICVLATTVHESTELPVLYCRREGAGRVFYTALGHSPDQWRSEGFQRSLLAGLGWAARR